MTLVSSQTIETTQHRNGIRARFRYGFSSGRVVNIGPSLIPSGGDVEALRVALEPEAVRIAGKQDSAPVVRADGEIAVSGEASKIDVAKLYIARAMTDPDPVSAYYKLKRFNDFRISEGYTAEQAKSALSISDAKWDRIIARWTHLNSNSATIEAFKIVRDNDPGAR